MTEAQIRQRTFRERKYQYTKSLELRTNELESEVRRLKEENQQLSISSPPCDQSQSSNTRTSTPCLICRHILQFWRDGMTCPDSVTSESCSDV